MKIATKFMKKVFGASTKASRRGSDDDDFPNIACPHISQGSIDEHGGGTAMPTQVPSEITCGGLNFSARSRRDFVTQGPLKPSGKCPFLHGTVYSDPYPGYVHGNPKRGMCPHGCRPQLDSDITALESPKDTLLREAVEFIDLYYHERGDEMKGTEGFSSKEARIEAIKQSIDTTGTYEHTFDELQHGARVAWRNAPKCSNRKHWPQLKLLDCREVTTNQGMYDCCMQHLTKAMASGSSEAYITVFKPDGATGGPRIWNDQLLQYAAYNEGEGKVVGDPKNLRFTEMLKERFGWDGPPDGKKGPYDYLPLVVQSDPTTPPELFEVPLECAPAVHIHHPRYPELSSLSMRWYPIPAVCALDMSLGGIKYCAAPFNGWYANTEVLRDLTDEGRYNMLVPVAEALGIDVDVKPGDAPFWKDEVMHILSSAIYHSFKSAKIAMIDHHNLIDSFWNWYRDEMARRKYCPVNWKWVIPPMSSSTNRAYLGLNKAQEYTIKPAYLYGENAFALETKYFGKRDTSRSVDMFVQSVYMAMLLKKCVNRMRQRKHPVLIIYASVAGNAAKHASDLGALLQSCSNVSFFDACRTGDAVDLGVVLHLLQTATLVIFVSSTHGNGELPAQSQTFFSYLFEKYGNALTGKQCAVLGFGSTAYPIFCGAATVLSEKLAKSGAKEIVRRGECDSVKGEATAFHDWTAALVQKMAGTSSSPLWQKLLDNLLEAVASNQLRRRNISSCVQCEMFTADDVQNAAAKSFMYGRRASMGSSMSRSRRRSSLSSVASFSDDEGPGQSKHLMRIIASSGLNESDSKFLHGQVKTRTDIISYDSSGGENEGVSRKTSLVTIDLQSCGNPPYRPGDHIRIYPQNVASLEELQSFVSHLGTGDSSLDDQMFVSFNSPYITTSELAVTLPLVKESIGHLIPLHFFFANYVALEAPISMESCSGLSELATGSKDRALLEAMGSSKKDYEDMVSLCGVKWLDIFKTFPSLSGRVDIPFFLSNMKMNHPRSYSIASCKEIVGNELHIVVGRFLYSRGGSKMEAGVSSTYLTSVESGDEIRFTLESSPSFHHPLDPSCSIVFVCTGTGFAPIRGLLQQRSYLRSRGETLGSAYLVFGSRSSSEGLFHDEINNFTKEGVLSKVFMCYSREMGEPREYTSDKLRSKTVANILSPALAEPNAHVYLCGSATMAEDAKNALREMCSQDCFDAVVQDGRLHSEVFGALTPQNRINKRHQSYTLGDEIDDVDFDSSLGELWHSEHGGLGLPKPGRRSSSVILGRNVTNGKQITLEDLLGVE